MRRLWSRATGSTISTVSLWHRDLALLLDRLNIDNGLHGDLLLAVVLHGTAGWGNGWEALAWLASPSGFAVPVQAHGEDCEGGDEHYAWMVD